MNIPLVEIIKTVLGLLFPVFGFSQMQNSGLKPNWRLDHPFEQKVFIENNEGQFDGKIDSGKVLFNTSINGISLLFTSTGVTYRYDEYLKSSPEQREEAEHEKDKKDLSKPVTYFFAAQWKGANPNTEVIAEDEVSFYYCYAVNSKHTTIAHAFKKLLYKNLYPGIDVEYFFPERKKGMEYSIIVHPGADLANVKLVYNDATSISKDDEGNLILQSSFGEFIDHAPEKTWYQESNENLSSSFFLKGNEVTFSAGKYDKSKTLVIDPWTINPGFNNSDAAYDLDWDLQGNVYALGNTYTNQLIKLNSSGNIQWIFDAVFTSFDASQFYGGFTVNKNNGTSYIGLGWGNGSGRVLKVNTFGMQTDSVYNLPNAMEEIWRMKYNECNGTIIMGGGGTDGEGQAEILDTNLSHSGSFNLLSTPYICHDVVLMNIDYTDGSCYFAMSKNDLTDSGGIGNVIIKTSDASLLTVSYIVPDGYAFREGYSNKYTSNQVANGMNGMVTTKNWLYLYDGSTLKRFNKNNGSLSATKNISTSVYGNAGVIYVYWGGIDVDKCENIYLGNDSIIQMYDSTLSLVNTFIAPSKIYDLQLASNNLMYVCGKGFIASYTLVNPPLVLSKTSTTACSNCNGTALASLTGCGSGEASYLWSNGQTNQYITGLCAGTYSVTISIDCETKYSDTFNIAASNNPSLNIPTSQVVDVSCFDGDNGSATAIASGGTSPYFYAWFPSNNTNQTFDNLSIGTYTVITTDSKGCGTLDTVTLTQPSQLNLSVSPNISIIAGQSTELTANSNGGTPPYTYSWNRSSTGTSLTASPLVNTIYTVVVSDNNGCEATAFVTVDVICGGIFVPDAFSPNEDGHNDILYVRGPCISTMDFNVFDRWGNKVYESQNPMNGWNGYYKGVPMNSGTYVWYLKATLYDGTSIAKKGNVTLVR